MKCQEWANKSLRRTDSVSFLKGDLLSRSFFNNFLWAADWNYFLDNSTDKPVQKDNVYKMTFGMDHTVFIVRDASVLIRCWVRRYFCLII